MADLIDLITSHATDPAAEDHLRQQTSAQVAALRRTAGLGCRHWVAESEQIVAANPHAAFAFDSTGVATLCTPEHRWHAGRFETPSLKDLRARLDPEESSGEASRRLRLWLLVGESSLTDIGSLQATFGDRTLFQVASQFNCLESPGRYVTRVSNYFNDRTQGPRAAISAFPAALLSHYSAPGNNGERFVQQTDGPQINLLEDACGSGVLQNGYFTGHGLPEVDSLAAKLETNFEAIRVGVHDKAQVVLGYDWDGGVEENEQYHIAQVLTSTVAGGFYGGQDNLGGRNFTTACRQLLRAAYLGTLLAALSLQRPRVVLTLIGGGVFSNPLAEIWEAMIWAAREVVPSLTQDLNVIINGRDIGSRFDLDGVVLPVTRQFDGAILHFDDSRLVRIQR